MKVEFKIAKHSILSGEVVELWFDGQFIGQITPLSHEAGIRIISKHAREIHDRLMVTEVKIRL